MYIALSITSTQGVWALVDTHLKLLDSRVWQDQARGDLWKDIETSLDSLLNSNQMTLDKINTIFCASGPGAFTGLRIASSYCKGLSLSLGIAMIALPSIDFNSGSPFFIPVRQQLLVKMTKDEALSSEKKFEFLKITGEQSAALESPSKNDLIWGLSDSNPFWPTPEQLCHSISKRVHSNEAFKLFYGLGPKVFGSYLKEG